MPLSFDDLPIVNKPQDATNAAPVQQLGGISFDDIGKTSDFGKSLKRGSLQAISSVARAGEAVATKFGSETGKRVFDTLAGRLDKAAEAYAPNVTLQDVADNPSNLGGYFVEKIGEQVPQLVGSMAGAYVGNKIGVKAGAPQLGTAAGAFVPSAIQNTGDIYGEMKEAGIDDPDRAMSFGAAAGALDAITPGQMVGGLVKEGLKKAAGQTVKQKLVSVSKDVAKGFGKGVLSEAPTEMLQEDLAMQARAGIDGTFDQNSREAWMRRIDAGLAGGLVGGATGAVTHPLEGALAPKNAIPSFDDIPVNQAGTAATPIAGDDVAQPATDQIIPTQAPVPVPPQAPIAQDGQPVSVPAVMPTATAQSQPAEPVKPWHAPDAGPLTRAMGRGVEEGAIADPTQPTITEPFNGQNNDIAGANVQIGSATGGLPGSESQPGQRATQPGADRAGFGEQSSQESPVNPDAPPSIEQPTVNGEWSAGNDWDTGLITDAHDEYRSAISHVLEDHGEDGLGDIEAAVERSFINDPNWGEHRLSADDPVFIHEAARRLLSESVARKAGLPSPLATTSDIQAAQEQTAEATPIAESTAGAAPMEQSQNEQQSTEKASQGPKVPAIEPSAKPSQPDSYDKKWFGSIDKANAFITKAGISTTHEPVADGKKFVIRKKATPAETQAMPEQLSPATSTQETAQNNGGGFSPQFHSYANWIQSGNPVPTGMLQNIAADTRLSDGESDILHKMAEELAPANTGAKPSQTESDGNNLSALEQKRQQVAQAGGDTSKIDNQIKLEKVRQSRKNGAETSDSISKTAQMDVAPLGEDSPGEWGVWMQDGDVRRHVASFTRNKDDKPGKIKHHTQSSAVRGMVDDAVKAHQAKRDADTDALFKKPDGKKPKAAETAPEPSKPMAATSPDSSLFANNKIFTADKVEAARARLKAKLGNINSGIDPEMLVDGMTIAGAYIEGGVRQFKEWSEMLVSDFGDGIKPYLLSFWEGARNYPGLDKSGMTSQDEAAKLHAEMMATTAEEANDAIGTVEKKPAKRTPKTGKPSDKTLTQDWGMSHIDAYSDEGEQVKAAFLKDAAGYLKAVSDALQEAGYTPHLDKKGRPTKPVSTNESGIAGSGDVSLTLRDPGKGVNLYVHVGDSALRGTVPTTASGISIMARASTNEGDQYAVNGQNTWLPVDLSVAELVDKLAKISHSATVHTPVVAPVDEQGNNQDTDTDKDAGNDTDRNEGGRNTPLDFGAPEDGEKLDESGLSNSGIGSGQADENGNERTETNRTGRGDSLDGGKKPVLPRPATKPRSPAGGLSQEKLPPGEAPSNFVITADFPLGEGTDGVKLRNNIAAIRIIKSLEEEGRWPTREEQAALAKYVGWGGLKTVFNPIKDGQNDQWAKAQRELKELLTEEEYLAAFKSGADAHYTARGVVDAMWRVVRHFGFNGGRVLEPTVGSGNFIGLQPADLAASSEWHASELDSITSKIAKYNYPQANVLTATGFQDAPFADGVFDLAIGNPPFGSTPISDNSKQRKHLSGMKIHNYIIAKTGMHLRPGGVMAMVVTHRFLDTHNPEARDVLAKDFRFLGAFRLPNDAFAANAGTEVVTDVIFLQKLDKNEARERDAAWLDTNGAITVDGQSIRVNRYYQENPSNILGRSAMDGTMYAGRRGDGAGEYTVHGDGRDLGKAIDDLMANQWANLAGKMQPSTAQSDLVGVMLSQSDLPVGGVTLTPEGKIIKRYIDDDNGSAVVKEVTPETLWKDQADKWLAVQSAAKALKAATENGRSSLQNALDFRDAASFSLLSNGAKKSSPTKAEEAIYAILDAVNAAMDSGTALRWRHDAELDRITEALDKKRLGEDSYQSLKAMLDLRARTIRLVLAEKRDDAMIEAYRTDLNRAYDAFVAKFGPLSDPDNASLLDGDVQAESGLEVGYKPAVSKAKSQATGLPVRKASAEKADILSRRVNFPYREITHADSPLDGFYVSMAEKGRLDLAYIAKLTNLPVNKVIAELSGGDNPVIFFDPKTEEYEDADSYLSGNVKRKLQLARDAGLKQNVAALEKRQPEPLPQSRIKPNIRAMWIPESVFEDFLDALGTKAAKVSIYPGLGLKTAKHSGIKLTDMGLPFQNEDRDIAEIFASASAGKAVVIMRSDGNGGSYKDDTATSVVNALVERMAKVFEEWAYQDAARSKLIVSAFNEKMNTHVKRQYDGVKYLKTYGANPSVNLRRTQKNAAWRMMQEQTVLLDHVVGAGKTYTIITGAMERRRLGLSKKPMIAVPNHLVTQWAKDFYKLYPGAKILAATPSDFEKNNRRRLFARIATGDFDAIIVGHSSLKFIENDPETVKTVIYEKVADLKKAMEDAKKNGESKRTLSQMRERLDRYEDKLDKLQEVAKDTIGFNFSDLGVDYLAVDEAHEFKNLEYMTSGERVVGMNDPKGSQRAFDLYMKVRSLYDAGNGIAFATGTPVSNSLVEIYTVMAYLAHDELGWRNQLSFDSWLGTYGQTETKLEYTATQKLKPRRVLSALNNLTSLRQLYDQFTDVISMADLKRIYAEEMREKNQLDGGNRREEFPVPKVKGGKRQLSTGPITEAQKEYQDYLIARMQVIEAMAKDSQARKTYPKIDNPLFVLTDARKMSLDIRVVDPTAPRDENGKVSRSAEKIKAIYDKWHEQRGTQMVFCDLSTPAKTAGKEAKRIISSAVDKLYKESDRKIIKSRLGDMATYEDRWSFLKLRAEELLDGDSLNEAQRDGLTEWLGEVSDGAAAAMVTADTGFSVYDDLRSLLVEKGIPEREIAFIHDFETPEKKADLFDRMNAGYVRVLLGSSAKMGAGTNAQQRLVALHHLDAPWRPSDVEQREGRIIRQGNMFYEENPDEFEVEIYAYSTEQTSDAVMWQILERKARGIEQFRDGGIDGLQEEQSDSDSYAEFMATSTGNPVFRWKLEAEREVSELDADVRGLLMARSSAKAKLDRLPLQIADRKDFDELVSEFKLDRVEFGGESGSVEEFEKALSEADAEYRAKYAEFVDKKAEADAAIEKWEKAPEETRGKKPSYPVAPSMPNVISKSVQEKSGLARAVAAFLEKAKNRDQLVIEMGNVPVELVRIDTESTPYWDLYIIKDGLRISLGHGQAKEPAGSPKILQAINPNAIQVVISREKIFNAQNLRELEQSREGLEKTSSIAVDESRLKRAKEKLEWLTTQVKFAETRSDEERSKRKNRYIERDRVRPLEKISSASGKSEFAEREFHFEGRAFEGTGYVARGVYVSLLDAKDMETGKPVILSATVSTVDGKTEYDIINVFDQPDELTPATARAVRSQQAGGRVVSKESAQSLLMRHAGGLVEAGAAKAVQSAEELPKAVLRDAELQGLAPGEIKGLIHNGTFWVVAGNHANDDDVLRTIFHEMWGHYGLRNLIGEHITPKLAAVFRNFGGLPGVLDLGRKYGLTREYWDGFGQAEAMGDVRMTAQMKMRLMVEELVAHAAENQAAEGIVGKLKAFIGALRQFLRDMGLAKLASYGETDLLHLVASAKKSVMLSGKPSETPSVWVRGSSGDDRQKHYWFSDVEPGDSMPSYWSGDINLDNPKIVTQGLYLPGGPTNVERVQYSVTDQNGKVIGHVVVGVDDDHQIVALYELQTAEKGKGAGRRIVRTVLANASLPVHIDNIVESAVDFWKKMGVHAAYAGASVSIDWDDYEQANNANSANDKAGIPRLVLQSTNRAENAGRKGEVSGEAKEQAGSGWDKEGPTTWRVNPLFTKSGEGLRDLLSSDRSFNRWWHSTVGTQYHKARSDADFGRVFDIGQRYLNDVSRLAMAAESQAPTLLPKLGSISEVYANLKSVFGKEYPADLEAIKRPIFNGTLDEVVYSDEVLKAQFGLNERQVGMYHEFRKATNQSMDDLARSVIARILQNNPHFHPIDRAMLLAGKGTLAQSVGRIVDTLGRAADDYEMAGLKNEAATQREAAKRVQETVAKTMQLQRNGYAPLMRFGQYTVDVIEDGQRVFFSMYETQAEANRAARELASEFNGATIKQGVLSKETHRMFNGLTPETVSLFAKQLGMDENAAFQSYLQMAVSNRSAMKRLIRRKKVAGFSDDVTRVLASFVVSNARAASGNYHLGQMQQAVTDIPKHKGDVADEAAKLYKFLVDGSEDAPALRGYMFAHFLGGSVAAAAVNLSQPVLMTLPYLSQFASPAKVAKLLASAATDLKGKNADLQLRRALDRAEAEGIIAPHEIHQLMAEASGGMFDRSLKLRALKTAWGSFFAVSESINRRMSFIAAYKLAIENNIESPYQFAVRAVQETQGVYNRGNRPNLARGALGATLFTFKQFSIAYLEMLTRMYRRGDPQSKQALALAMVLLIGAAGTQGLPGMEDLEDLIDALGQLLGFPTNSRLAVRRAARDALGETAGQWVIEGVSALPGVGIDLHSRLGLGNLIPGTRLLVPGDTNKGDDVAEFFGPAGGLAKSAGDMVSKLASGDVAGAAVSMAPVAVQNAVKGARMAGKGYHEDSKGRKVADTTLGDAVAKGIGFQPSSIGQLQRASADVQRGVDMVKSRQADIADKWARGLADGDGKAVVAARMEMVKWNRDNPDMQIHIKPDSIMRRVREMKKNKVDRILKSAPRSMREQAKEDLG